MLMDLTLIIFIIFVILANCVYTQTICYNPTSNCFDPIYTQTLLFQYGQYTSCSRVPPINKLNCIDGDTPESYGLCSKYSKSITNIKCTNSGTDDSNNVIWKCEGILPSSIALGKTTVSCEGCTSSNDKLKITNSCGIFYQLVKKTSFNSKSNSNPKSNLNPNIIKIIIVGISFLLGLILLICLFKYVFYEPYEYLQIHTPQSRLYTNLTTLPPPPTPPINPYYIPNLSSRKNTNTPHYHSCQSYQTQTQIPTQTQSDIEMNNLCYNHRPQPQSHPHPQPYSQTQFNPYSDTSSLLTGYLVGKNLEEGNLGTAYLASTIGGMSGGNNYSTGLMMGMMNGSEYLDISHKPKHKPKHKLSYENDLYENNLYENNSYSNSETYAGTTTR